MNYTWRLLVALLFLPLILIIIVYFLLALFVLFIFILYRYITNISPKINFLFILNCSFFFPLLSSITVLFERDTNIKDTKLHFSAMHFPVGNNHVCISWDLCTRAIITFAFLCVCVNCSWIYIMPEIKDWVSHKL